MRKPTRALVTARHLRQGARRPPRTSPPERIAARSLSRRRGPRCQARRCRGRRRRAHRAERIGAERIAPSASVPSTSRMSASPRTSRRAHRCRAFVENIAPSASPSSRRLRAHRGRSIADERIADERIADEASLLRLAPFRPQHRSGPVVDRAVRVRIRPVSSTTTKSLNEAARRSESVLRRDTAIRDRVADAIYAMRPPHEIVTCCHLPARVDRKQSSTPTERVRMGFPARSNEAPRDVRRSHSDESMPAHRLEHRSRAIVGADDGETPTRRGETYIGRALARASDQRATRLRRGTSCTSCPSRRGTARCGPASRRRRRCLASRPAGGRSSRHRTPRSRPRSA